MSRVSLPRGGGGDMMSLRVLDGLPANNIYMCVLCCFEV